MKIEYHAKLIYPGLYTFEYLYRMLNCEYLIFSIGNYYKVL